MYAIETKRKKNHTRSSFVFCVGNKFKLKRIFSHARRDSGHFFLFSKCLLSDFRVNSVVGM